MAKSSDQSSVHFDTDKNISTPIWWIVMKFSTETHCVQRMNTSDIGDVLTFPVTPSAGQNVFCLSISWFTNANIWNSH